MEISLEFMIVAKGAVMNCKEAFHIIEDAIKRAALVGQMSTKEHECCWVVDHCVPPEVNFIHKVHF